MRNKNAVHGASYKSTPKATISSSQTSLHIQLCAKPTPRTSEVIYYERVNQAIYNVSHSDNCQLSHVGNPSNPILEVLMQITVQAKNNYGTTVFYPVCRLAEQFAGMVRQKTLTRADLEKIKAMEVSIIIKQEEVKI